jgi:hypothetical protein
MLCCLAKVSSRARTVPFSTNGSGAVYATNSSVSLLLSADEAAPPAATGTAAAAAGLGCFTTAKKFELTPCIIHARTRKN